MIPYGSKAHVQRFMFRVTVEAKKAEVGWAQWTMNHKGNA